MLPTSSASARKRHGVEDGRSHDFDDEDNAKRKQKPGAAREGLLIVCGILSMTALVLGPILHRYSAALLLPPSAKRLDLSAEAVQSLVESHRFVVIGGPHRGGTTILWRMLTTAHADVSGFPEFTDSDYAEGAFLQTVLPTFGVGAAAGPGGGGGAMGSSSAAVGGLGRYALSPSAHMTETHPLLSNASASQLLSEWGYYWNLSKPVLVEKTPTNMVTSRLLRALLMATSLRAAEPQFLFITRHPLAVSLAHKRWSACARMSVPSLLLHWLVSHVILASDMSHLTRRGTRSARILRYEDLVRRPRACLEEALSWLQLPSAIGEPAEDDRPRAIDTVLAGVAGDTNRKYETEYCNSHLGKAGNTEYKRHGHCAAANALAPTLDRLGLGYSLSGEGDLGFHCVRSSLHAAMADHGSLEEEAKRARHAEEAAPGLLSREGVVQEDPCDHVAPDPWLQELLNTELERIQQPHAFGSMELVGLCAHTPAAHMAASEIRM